MKTTPTLHLKAILAAERGSILARLPSNFTGQIRLPPDVGLSALSPLLRANAVIVPMERLIPQTAEELAAEQDGKAAVDPFAHYTNFKIGADGGKDICAAVSGIIYPIPRIRLALIGEEVPSWFWTASQVVPKPAESRRAEPESQCCLCS